MYYFGVESQAKFVNREVTKEEERAWLHLNVMLYLCHNKDNKNKGYEKH